MTEACLCSECMRSLNVSRVATPSPRPFHNPSEKHFGQKVVRSSYAKGEESVLVCFVWRKSKRGEVDAFFGLGEE
jgi:hypothetical protein